MLLVGNVVLHPPRVRTARVSFFLDDFQLFSYRGRAAFPLFAIFPFSGRFSAPGQEQEEEEEEEEEEGEKALGWSVYNTFSLGGEGGEEGGVIIKTFTHEKIIFQLQEYGSVFNTN